MREQKAMQLANLLEVALNMMPVTKEWERHRIAIVHAASKAWEAHDDARYQQDDEIRNFVDMGRE